VFVLSAFRNSFNPVKLKTLRNRHFAPSFVLTLRNQVLRLTKCFEKPVTTMPQVEHKPVNSTHVSIVARSCTFRSQIIMSDWRNFEKVNQQSTKTDTIWLMMSLTFQNCIQYMPTTF